MSRHENLLLDHQLCFALYAAMHAVTRRYRAGLGEFGLTYPQYLVLLALWEGQPQSVGELARRLALDPPTLTPLLKRLAAAGLVTRHRDPADERIVRIRTTAAADGLRERLAALQSQVACATGLAPAEFAVLRASLHRLTQTMAAGRDTDPDSIP